MKYNAELKDKKEAMIKVKKLDYDRIFNQNQDVV